MKVSLITLHRVTNFGSLLQTYATQKTIEKLGHTCVTVDFQPVGLSFYRAIWPKNQGALKKLIKLPANLICNAIQFSMVNKFLNKHITMTEKRYKSFKDLEMDIPNADIYLSGSDQIWNTQNSNEADDIKAYYLCFVPSEKTRVAYSGSFGRTEFPQDQLFAIKKWLQRYRAISVREDAALNILKEAGLDNGVHVLDPTLLLKKEEWEELCVKNPPDPGYIFVYNLNRNKLIAETAQALAKEKNLRIINFADTFEFVKGAENKMFNTPYDFINCIMHADYVVTDSFHGTAFSINFNKNFICVPAPAYNSRIESILRIAGLIDTRYVKNIEQAENLFDQDINWDEVNSRIEQYRKTSIKFLEDAFENV